MLSQRAVPDFAGAALCNNLRAAGIHFKLTCLHQEPARSLPYCQSLAHFLCSMVRFSREPAVFLPYCQSVYRFLCSMVRFSCKPAVSLPYCQSFACFLCSMVQKSCNHAIFLFCWFLLQCSEKINFSVFCVFFLLVFFNDISCDL